jgi:hypothetical protein
LSELLASKPKPSDELDESAEKAATPESVRPPELVSRMQTPRRVPPVSAPVVFEELPADEPESESGEELFPYSSFQIDLDDAALPEPEEESPAQEVAPPRAEEFASHPPFPTPEEYEREEFSFDLEPTMAMEPEPAAQETPSNLPGDGIADTVSRSLSEFERDLPMDEPLFDLEPESPAAVVPQPSPPVAPPLVEPFPVEQPADDAAPTAEAEPLTEADAESSGLDDAEMQEALDLMFPIQPEAEEEPAAPETQSLPEPEEESVPIVQKQEVPSSAQQGGFQAGERVRHATYGEGVIQKIIPMEDTVILNIQFDSVGKRLLDPALCDLQHV